MKLSDLLGKEIVDHDLDVIGITSDSRLVNPGFIFAALQGSVHDGVKFIPQAEVSGAAAIIAKPGTPTKSILIESDEPRQRLAELAARVHSGQPETIVGVTGTNGKTSVARFCQQLWTMMGLQAGSLGTLGAFSAGYEYTLRHTTPDPVEIHQVLSTMAKLGATHLAMEVSSHGLEQYRADGVDFSLAAFTNITRDHLDYHPTFEEYFSAKMRLFTELLPVGHLAVVNIDGAESDKVAAAVLSSGRRLMTVGKQGEDIKLLKTIPLPDGQELTVEASGKVYALHLPLVGYFQAENAMVAAGLVIGSGFEPENVMPLLANLEGAPGRMEHVADRIFTEGSAGIYVDFAHTPDAIDTALQAIKPHAQGKVIIVFGAGGDRDKVKRPLMGRAASSLADIVIVTDDNPRTEDPAQIRKEVLSGCNDAQEIGDRREAIERGIAQLNAGDVLLIAGKGHETGQTIGTMTTPFNDAEVARSIMAT